MWIFADPEMPRLPFNYRGIQVEDGPITGTGYAYVNKKKVKDDQGHIESSCYRDLVARLDAYLESRESKYHSTESVAEIVGLEGLEYSIIHRIVPDDIIDPELASLWEDAQNTIAKITKILEQ